MWFLSSAAAQVVELPDDDPLVSLRLRSMGGAATGLAESASANLENPAAIGIRRSPATEARIDTDVTLQARDHPLLGAIFGTSAPPYRSSYYQLGATLRVERVGVAVGWRETRVSQGGEDVGTFLASAGAALSEGAWVVGVLPQLFGVQGDNRGLAAGFGGTVGASWSPEGPLRWGASFRTPMRSGQIRGPGPTVARLPVEAQLGIVYSPGFHGSAGRWGPVRTRLPSAVAAHLTAELVVTGGSADAVVLAEGDETPETSGTTLSPRAGAEVQLFEDHLRLRGGLGLLAGRGGSPREGYGTGGVAWQLLRDPRGFGWRLAAGGEWYGVTGPALTLALETW